MLIANVSEKPWIVFNDNLKKVLNRSDITQERKANGTPRMHLSLWRWFVLVAPVSSEVTVAGQSVPDLDRAFIGLAGESVCPLAQGLHT